jgi:branched-chain amino acid transport system substrate-binding protein
MSMKRIVITTLLFSLLLAACGGGYNCTDPLGCVTVKSGAPITIAVALTLSGPDAPYGTDALRGVAIAITDYNEILNHPIALIQEDDQCSADGGEAAAKRLAENPDITGVIGTTCSSAAVPAAKILTEAGTVLISPSSTAASLTSAETHQAGFLRTIYNDKSQAKTVAEFAYVVLGARRMATIHDGTPYSQELQEEACTVFEVLGGLCVEQFLLNTGSNPKGALNQIALFAPDVLYYPLYTIDGVAVTRQISEAGLGNAALISSDGLLSSDFIAQTKNAGQGIYLSGPSTLKIDPSFYEKYEARYGEKPIAVYAAQGYDAAMILIAAIEKVAIRRGAALYIPRQALRDALYATKNFQGLSGTLTCSSLGDCAAPNIVIYQLRGLEFKPIYP